jgi:hypothetical protein
VAVSSMNFAHLSGINFQNYIFILYFLNGIFNISKWRRRTRWEKLIYAKNKERARVDRVSKPIGFACLVSTSAF